VTLCNGGDNDERHFRRYISHDITILLDNDKQMQLQIRQHSKQLNYSTKYMHH